MTTRTLLSAMLLVLPLTMWAQDDMYFASSKKAKQEAEAQKQARQQTSQTYVFEDADDEPLNITGSSRNVDEYNRRGYSSQRQADSGYSIGVPAGDSVTVSTRSLLDNAYERGYDAGYMDGEDYALTRRMGRFGYSSVYSSPWYSSYYYDPFYYDSWHWNDPFYYGYYSWNRPYWGYTYGYYSPYWHNYYGYYGWHRPYYHYGYYGGWHGTSVHRGGHIPRNTQYTDRYYNLRNANRHTVTNRGNSGSSSRSVRSGQSAPIGSRGSSTIRNSGSSSSSSSSRSSSPSVNRGSSGSSGSSGGFGGVVRGSSSSGTSGGFSGGGGNGSRSAGGSRGGRR